MTSKVDRISNTSVKKKKKKLKHISVREILPNKLGKAVEASADKNCLHCSLFLSCRDRLRGYDYRCSKYTTLKKISHLPETLDIDDTADDEDFTDIIMDNKKKGRRELDRAKDAEHEEEFDNIIADTIEDEAKSPVPRDLRIDDHDIAQAPNFYEWVMGKKWLNFAKDGIKPWAKQFQIGVNAFSEYCVAIGTKLQTEKGLIRIEDYAPYEGMVSMSGKILSKSGVNKVSYGGMTKRSARCLGIVGANGSTIPCTPEHEIYILDKTNALVWKKAKNLKIGDYLVGRYGDNFWPEKPAKIPSGLKLDVFKESSNYYSLGRIRRASSFEDQITINLPKRMTPELARLLGYLTGDGHVGEYGINFINMDRAIIQDFIQCLKTIFPDVKIFKGRSHLSKKCKTVNVNSAVVARTIEFLGLIGNHSNKRIPKLILQSSREIVINYIKAYMDCDGSLSARRVRVSSSSHELIQDLHLLLQNLGILGKYEEHYEDSYRRVSDGVRVKFRDGKIHSHAGITINQPIHIRAYTNIIGTNNSQRLSDCQKLARRPDRRHITHKRFAIDEGHVPFAKCKELVDSVTSRSDRNRIRNHLRPHQRANVQTAQSLIEAYDGVADEKIINDLKIIANDKHLFFTKIVALTDLGELPVFDLTVPKEESFQANGLIIHNCPHCSDKIYVKNIPLRHKPHKLLERIELLQFGVCPRCKASKAEMYCAGEYEKLPSELALMLGQRSSKSTTSAMMMTYQAHAYMKLQSPARAFKLPSNTILHGIVTGLTWKAAQELLYDPVYTFMLDSPFFREYHAMLDEYERKYGQKFYQLGPAGYLNRARNISIYPMGPDRKKMRGRTGYLAGIDEIGLFNAPDEKKSGHVKENAEEVYNSLRNSMNTLRPAYYKMMKRARGSNILPPMLYTISSPMSKRDMMVKLYERSIKNPRVYGLHAATWEINPNITYEDLMEEFKFDGGHSKVMRDFGAVPPNSALPWVQDITLLNDSIDKTLNNRVSALQILKRTDQKNRAGTEWTTGKFLALAPKDTNKRAMALDAGYNDNSFALTAGFWDTKLERAVIDCWLEVIPSYDNPVNFSFIYEDIIEPFVQFANVELVLSDRWQNKKILHDLESHHHTVTAEHTVKYDEYSTYRSELINGGFTVPHPKMSPKEIEAVGDKSYPTGFIGKPLAHWAFQCITVQDTKKSVDKGEGTTDDLLRASVLLHTFLIDPDPEIRKLCSGTSMGGNRYAGPFGVLGLLSVPLIQQQQPRYANGRVQVGVPAQKTTIATVGLMSSKIRPGRTL
jgi:intein/homing endonuclease